MSNKTLNIEVKSDIATRKIAALKKDLNELRRQYAQTQAEFEKTGSATAGKRLISLRQQAEHVKNQVRAAKNLTAVEKERGILQDRFNKSGDSYTARRLNRSMQVEKSLQKQLGMETLLDKNNRKAAEAFKKQKTQAVRSQKEFEAMGEAEYTRMATADAKRRNDARRKATAQLQADVAAANSEKSLKPYRTAALEQSVKNEDRIEENAMSRRKARMAADEKAFMETLNRKKSATQKAIKETATIEEKDQISKSQNIREKMAATRSRIKEKLGVVDTSTKATKAIEKETQTEKKLSKSIEKTNKTLLKRKELQTGLTNQKQHLLDQLEFAAGRAKRSGHFTSTGKWEDDLNTARNQLAGVNMGGTSSKEIKKYNKELKSAKKTLDSYRQATTRTTQAQGFMNSGFAKFSIVMSGIAATLFVAQNVVAAIKSVVAAGAELEDQMIRMPYLTKQMYAAAQGQGLKGPGTSETLKAQKALIGAGKDPVRDLDKIMRAAKLTGLEYRELAWASNEALDSMLKSHENLEKRLNGSTGTAVERFTATWKNLRDVMFSDNNSAFKTLIQDLTKLGEFITKHQHKFMQFFNVLYALNGKLGIDLFTKGFKKTFTDSPGKALFDIFLFGAKNFFEDVATIGQHMIDKVMDYFKDRWEWFKKEYGFEQKEPDNSNWGNYWDYFTKDGKLKENAAMKTNAAAGVKSKSLSLSEKLESNNIARAKEFAQLLKALGNSFGIKSSSGPVAKTQSGTDATVVAKISKEMSESLVQTSNAIWKKVALDTYSSNLIKQKSEMKKFGMDEQNVDAWGQNQIGQFKQAQDLLMQNYSKYKMVDVVTGWKPNGIEPIIEKMPESIADAYNFLETVSTAMMEIRGITADTTKAKTLSQLGLREKSLNAQISKHQTVFSKTKVYSKEQEKLEKELADIKLQIEAIKGTPESERKKLEGAFRKERVGKKNALAKKSGEWLTRFTDMPGYYESIERRSIYSERKQAMEFASNGDERQQVEKATTEALRQLDIKKLESSKQWTAGATLAFMKYENDALNAATQFETYFSSSMTNMENTLVDFCMTGKMNWKDMVNTMLSDLIRLQSKMLIFGPISKGLSMAISGFMGGSATPTSMESFYGPTSAKGNVFGGHGIVKTPTLFPFARGTGLMGEAGPEAIMPLTRLPGGNLGVHANSANTSAAPNVKIVVNNNTGTDAKVRQEQPKWNGKEFVIGVWLDAYKRNVGGMRSMLNG